MVNNFQFYLQTKINALNKEVKSSSNRGKSSQKKRRRINVQQSFLKDLLDQNPKLISVARAKSFVEPTIENLERKITYGPQSGEEKSTWKLEALQSTWNEANKSNFNSNKGLTNESLKKLRVINGLASQSKLRDQIYKLTEECKRLNKTSNNFKLIELKLAKLSKLMIKYENKSKSYENKNRSLELLGQSKRISRKASGNRKRSARKPTPAKKTSIARTRSRGVSRKEKKRNSDISSAISAQFSAQANSFYGEEIKENKRPKKSNSKRYGDLIERTNQMKAELLREKNKLKSERAALSKLRREFEETSNVLIKESTQKYVAGNNTKPNLKKNWNQFTKEKKKLDKQRRDFEVTKTQFLFNSAVQQKKFQNSYANYMKEKCAFVEESRDFSSDKYAFELKKNKLGEQSFATKPKRNSKTKPKSAQKKRSSSTQTQRRVSPTPQRRRSATPQKRSSSKTKSSKQVQNRQKQQKQQQAKRQRKIAQLSQERLASKQFEQEQKAQWERQKKAKKNARRPQQKKKKNKNKAVSFGNLDLIYDTIETKFNKQKKNKNKMKKANGYPNMNKNKNVNINKRKKFVIQNQQNYPKIKDINVNKPKLEKNDDLLFVMRSLTKDLAQKIEFLNQRIAAN